jgi:hypothetical protein
VQGFLFAPPVTGDEISSLLCGGHQDNEAIRKLTRRWPFGALTRRKAS